MSSFGGSKEDNYFERQLHDYLSEKSYCEKHNLYYDECRTENGQCPVCESEDPELQDYIFKREDEAFKAVISCLNINHYQKYFDSKGLYSGIYPECGLFKIIIKTTSPNYANIKYKYRTIYNAVEQNRKSAEKHLLEKLFFFLKNGYKIYKKREM